MGFRRTAPAAINNKMTYNDILEFIDNLDEEQLEKRAFVMVDEEIYPITQTLIQEGTSEQLTDGDPYLVID